MQDFLETHFSPTDPILLACSTGPDSMYLLYKILETKYAKNLVTCYFNHKLRPEADEEEQFLEKLGKEKGFTVEIAEADILKIKEKFYASISTEELARKKRYEFFDAIMHIYGSKKILLAHHLDDKIETFFFNLARGSKITGLVNMQEYSGSILRPLLHTTKTEILEYLDKHNLKYKIDTSNAENLYTRNKLRNQILPLFSAVNPEYKKHISHFMNYLGEVKDMIDDEVEKFLKIPYNKRPIADKTGLKEKKYFLIDDFNSLSPFLQKEVIRYIFYISNNHSTIGLSQSNINEVIKFINGKNNKTRKEIKGLSMQKDNKKIYY